jgi:hypothetical protein
MIKKLQNMGQRKMLLQPLEAPDKFEETLQFLETLDKSPETLEILVKKLLIKIEKKKDDDPMQHQAPRA